MGNRLGNGSLRRRRRRQARKQIAEGNAAAHCALWLAIRAGGSRSGQAGASPSQCLRLGTSLERRPLPAYRGSGSRHPSVRGADRWSTNRRAISPTTAANVTRAPMTGNTAARTRPPRSIANTVRRQGMRRLLGPSRLAPVCRNHPLQARCDADCGRWCRSRQGAAAAASQAGAYRPVRTLLARGDRFSRTCSRNTSRIGVPAKP